MLPTSTFVKPQQQLVEIIIQADKNGNTVTPAYFTTAVAAFFINRKILAIETFYQADIFYSPISPGVPIVSLALFNRLSATFLRNDGNGVTGGDFYKNIPLSFLRRVINSRQAGSTGPDLFRMDPIGLSWTDSSVLLPAPVAISEPVSVPFLVTYLLEQQDPEPYKTVKLRGHAAR
jgi:hypothetical protein